MHSGLSKEAQGLAKVVNQNFETWMKERLQKLFTRAKERNLVVDSKDIKNLLRQAYTNAISNLPTQATCDSIAVLIVG